MAMSGKLVFSQEITGMAVQDVRQIFVVRDLSNFFFSTLKSILKML